MAAPFDFDALQGEKTSRLSRRLTRALRRALARPRWLHKRGWRPEPMRLDAMEQRLLLNADLGFDLTTASGADEYIIRIDEADTDNDDTTEDVAVIQSIRVDSGTETILGEIEISGAVTSTVTGGSAAEQVTFEVEGIEIPDTVTSISLTINLNGGADRLIVDSSDLSALALPFVTSITADLGGGDDTLESASSINTRYEITGTDEGTADDQVVLVDFSDVENLQGGDADETFAIVDGGSLTGPATGGDGDDAVVGPDVDAVFAIIDGVDGGVTLKQGSFGSATAVATFDEVEILQAGAGQAVVDASALSRSGAEGVTLNLGAGFVDLNVSADDGTEFTVQNFDDIAGTDGDDVLIGNAEDNTVYANGGDDDLEGARGDDTYILTGAIGDDVTLTEENVLQGEIDTVDFSGATFAAGTGLLVDVADDLTIQMDQVTISGATVTAFAGFSIAAAGIENVIAKSGISNVLDFADLDTNVDVDLRRCHQLRDSQISV